MTQRDVVDLKYTCLKTTFLATMEELNRRRTLGGSLFAKRQTHGPSFKVKKSLKTKNKSY